MRYLLITDVPTPWREKVLENVYKKFGEEFHVVYCNDRERRRLWTFPLGRHSKTSLRKTLHIRWGDKEKYLNLGILPLLLKHRPKVVVCETFNPTIFLTLLVAKALRIRIGWLADTWLGRDNASWHQKVARKVTYTVFVDAFIGASKETLNWYRHYNKNIAKESLFISRLCADNQYFIDQLEGRSVTKRYDIMFAGRIAKEKNPLFLAEVASRIKEKTGACRALIIGDGEEQYKTEMFKRFEDAGVEYDFPGFIEHSRLPEFYSQAKVLLLPTSGDCWGVVINEAFISGMPVITTSLTAAAGDLVIDGVNGYVLPFDVELWAERICSLLENSNKYEAFSNRAREMVSGFTFEHAAEGIVGAIEYLSRQG
jgi:glycosyltransferase involved in cell wall biosynthesis